MTHSRSGERSAYRIRARVLLGVIRGPIVNVLIAKGESGRLSSLEEVTPGDLEIDVFYNPNRGRANKAGTISAGKHGNIG